MTRIQYEPREKACVFGQEHHLVGVVRPTAKPRSSRGAILVTPGMLHSAGPYRLHVDLARALSNVSIPSLRFDLSGIGESLIGNSSASSLDRAAEEISAAIDHLQNICGVEQVFLFGLCSGADDAIHTALTEKRVAGVFAMDGCGYRTRGYLWRSIAKSIFPKLMSREKWKSKFASWTLHRSGRQADSLRLGQDIREFPEREIAESQLVSLAARGVHLHFHYTGGVLEYYNHADQFWKMFPALVGNPHVSTSYASHCDHIAFLTQHRRELVQLVTSTLQRFETQALHTTHAVRRAQALDAEDVAEIAVPAVESLIEAPNAVPLLLAAPAGAALGDSTGAPVPVYEAGNPSPSLH